MLRDVLQNMSGLSDKWCVLLVQLPPRLEFDLPVAEAFISDLRKYCHRGIVWEPRHPSWGSADARQLLVDYRISKVLADPEPCPISKIDRSALEEVRYFRLHGSPEIYKSRYSAETISRIAQSMTRPVTAAAQTWCIFDNTTFGFATENAKEILDLVGDKNY